MAKERLDVLLVKRNLAESREKAKAYIMAGNVFVDGVREDKAGSSFEETVQIEVKGLAMKYVSRGGFKLEKAVDQFGVNLEGKTCMDVGSSTGGFTDCMLQNGAVKVFAIDVGTNQLAWKLREDNRVVCMERTNVRYISGEQIPELLDIAVMDVSFISIKLILPALKGILKPDADIICLIKPQFEAGKDKVGKKGVVRDIGVHREVVRDILDFCREHQLSCQGLDYSPIRGPEGNIEFLLWLKNSDNNALETDVDAVVDAAHKHIS